jgi:hypothetical protein
LSWTPAGGGQSHNAPAKLLIAGAQETFELDIFPVGPKLGGTDAPWTAASKLPAYMDNLPANPVGVSIEAIVGPKKVYNDIPQYKPTQITVLDGNPSPSPADPQASPRSAPTPPLDQNQMRIMRQSTLHYASILMAPMTKDFTTPQLMVERTILLAATLLEYVISGENPFGSEEESEGDFGSL